MTKKIFKCISSIVMFVLSYILQIYVINNTTFLGVSGDLCLMVVVITALIHKDYIAYITAGILGIVSDILFSPATLKYLVIYIIVVAVLLELKKMYRQDSKLAIIIFSVTGSVISEVIMYIFNIITKVEFVNIFSYVFMVIKGCIVNICLAFLVYLVLNLFKQEG